MGRNRKPTEDQDRKGAFDHDPARGRARANEPKPKGELPGPPAAFLVKSMDGEKRLQAWNDLLQTTASVRLTSADWLHFEATATLLYRTRRYDAKTSDFSVYIQALGKFGLNPVDRSKVNGHGTKTEAEEAGEWDEFADGGSELSVQ